MASKSALPLSTASAKPLLAKVLIVGFLVFIALVLWVSLFSKTPSTTSKNTSTQKSEEKNSTKTSVLNSNEEDWKVFKNEKFSYQIKYPKDWYVKTYSEIPNRTLFDSGPLPESQIADSEPVFSEIEISVTDEKNVEEEIIKLKSAYQFEDFSQKQVTVDGFQGVRIEGKVTGESYIKGNFYVGVFINRSSQTYFLVYTSDEKKNLEIFEQMLSALKFT